MRQRISTQQIDETAVASASLLVCSTESHRRLALRARIVDEEI
jgi:hypothetical protein